jgi:hypothetical protein
MAPILGLARSGPAPRFCCCQTLSCHPTHPHLHVRPFSSKLATASVFFSFLVSASAEPVEPVNFFVEANFPFLQTAVDLSPSDLPKSAARSIVVRGILLTPPGGFCVLFDQELLRVAAIWRTPEGGAPLKLASMSQVSYAEPHRKAGNNLPTPAHALFQLGPPVPGISTHEAGLRTDPRPGASAREYGRGPLPQSIARFEGISLQEDKAVIHYAIGSTAVREWFASSEGQLRRHIQISHHTDPLYLTLAQEENFQWQVEPGNHRARAGSLGISADSPGTVLQTTTSTLLAEITPSATPRTLVFSYQTGEPPPPRPPTLRCPPQPPGFPPGACGPKASKLPGSSPPPSGADWSPIRFPCPW